MIGGSREEAGDEVFPVEPLGFPRALYYKELEGIPEQRVSHPLAHMASGEYGE